MWPALHGPVCAMHIIWTRCQQGPWLIGVALKAGRLPDPVIILRVARDGASLDKVVTAVQPAVRHWSITMPCDYAP